MSDPLSSNTQEQMRALCRKISVAHDLDLEIQKELYGHIEDKLLGYLSGEEQVSEEDAFILVREHFGDPAVLKSLLQDVHAHEVHVSLARRIAAAVVATTALLILWTLLLSIVMGVLVVFAAEDGSFGVWQWIMPITSVLALIGAALLLWVGLRHWQRQLDAGHRPWFLRWPPGSIVLVTAGVFLLQKVVPFTVVPELMTMERGPATGAVLGLFVALGALSFVLQCAAWLWWCDRPPRRTRALVYGFFAWSLTFMLWWAVPPLVLSIFHSAAEQASSSLNHISLAQGHVPSSSFQWQLYWRMLPPWGAFQMAAFTFLYAVGCGYVARVLYALGKHIRRRYAERVQPT